MTLPLRILVAALGTGGCAAAEPSTAGAAIYLEKCALCHQAAGQGASPIFPPLARSDWLRADRARAIRVVCEGLDGPIEVNGQVFNNAMPAQVLDDTEVAEVLTYITNSWGNTADPFTAEEVKSARAKGRFATFAELQKAAAFESLPAPPAGWRLREVAQLPAFCTRLASDGTGRAIYVLGERGVIYRLQDGVVVPWIQPGDYAGSGQAGLTTLGLAVGPDRRLWLVGNRKIADRGPHDLNEITLWRSTPVLAEDAAAPKWEVWFRTSYPYGIGPFNHGVSHLAFGPDGMLYVTSGSRTDSGERGRDSRAFTGGEVEITACLWRLDPKSTNPTIEVIARGLRNAYGFAWNGQGQLFTVSNGPDADAPEEMDVIVPGRHYGFPYQFSNWPLLPKPYPHTPDPPAGLDAASFVRPVLNIGPGAGGSAQGIGTFHPHSCPTGMIWCGDQYPELVRGGFVVGRFGNLLGRAEDVGFDLLSVRPEQGADGTWRARVTPLLAPLARPIDVHPTGGGKLLVLEYCRSTNFKDKIGMLPGRLLELAPE